MQPILGAGIYKGRDFTTEVYERVGKSVFLVQHERELNK